MIVNLKVTSVYCLTSQSKDRARNIVVCVEQFAVFDCDSTGLVLQHRQIVYTLPHKLAVLKLTCDIFIVLLPNDPHNIVEYARLQLLFLKKRADDDSGLERFDVKDVFNDLQIVLVPFFCSCIFDHWS